MAKPRPKRIVKPFTAATGIADRSWSTATTRPPAIKAMVEAGNVTVDVASVEYADAIRLCDEGVLEPIDIAIAARRCRWHPGR